MKQKYKFTHFPNNSDGKKMKLMKKREPISYIPSMANIIIKKEGEETLEKLKKIMISSPSDLESTKEWISFIENYLQILDVSTVIPKSYKPKLVQQVIQILGFFMVRKFELEDQLEQETQYCKVRY